MSAEFKVVTTADGGKEVVPNPVNQMTLRKLLESIKKQGDYEGALDLPLIIGVRDDYAHFDTASILSDYPNRTKYTLRIDCHISRKRMVENKSK